MRSIGPVRAGGDTTTSRMCIVMIRRDCVVEEDLPPRFGRLMKVSVFLLLSVYFVYVLPYVQHFSKTNPLKMISTRGKNALQVENSIKAAEIG
jgi:hypothetical protein